MNDENSRLENTQPSQRAPEAEGKPVSDDSAMPPHIRPDSDFNTVINQLPPNSNANIL